MTAEEKIHIIISEVVVLIFSHKAEKYISKKCILSSHRLSVFQAGDELVKSYGYQLVIYNRLGQSQDAVNCNAGLFKFSPIFVTQHYAMQLMLNPSVEMHNMFMMSLGHELTHKEGDLCPLTGLLSNRLSKIPANIQFLSYVNEVHADFGAAQKAADSKRSVQANAIAFKIRHREEKRDFEHPSWSQRLDYIENYNFNEKPIRQIANDTCCTNEKLIQKAIKHFPEIVLN